MEVEKTLEPLASPYWSVKTRCSRCTRRAFAVLYEDDGKTVIASFLCLQCAAKAEREITPTRAA